MIRIVALGVVCLAGLGAIAAAAKKLTPPRPEVVMPLVSNNKTDRLPTTVTQDNTQPDAEKVDVVYVTSGDQNQADPPLPASQEPGPARHPDITPRHGHDRHHAKANTERRRASSANQKMRAADPSPAQVSELKECRSDGLNPLLRQLNLAPPCN